MPYKKSVLSSADFEFAVNREFEAVERGINDAADTLLLNKLYAEPTLLKAGLIAYADGTTWNPGGGGQGVYYYNGSAWVKLG